MKAKPVPQADVKSRFGLLSVGLLGLAGLISVVLVGTAVAAPVLGSDGQLHACYRVKGKVKGAMRVVPAGGKCRRGERKLAWSVAGPASQPGAQGAPGQPGSSGANGTSGTSGTSTAALETKVATLTTKVESLEGILDNVDNAGLTKAVGLIPTVDSLCTQSSALTTRVNALGTSLSGATLGGIIPLGLTMTIPGLLSDLPDNGCP